MVGEDGGSTWVMVDGWVGAFQYVEWMVCLVWVVMDEVDEITGN